MITLHISVLQVLLAIDLSAAFNTLSIKKLRVLEILVLLQSLLILLKT